MKRFTDSASSRSCSAVEPIRSAKKIVTTLRVSGRSALGDGPLPGIYVPAMILVALTWLVARRRV
jgi:hypothetical protein